MTVGGMVTRSKDRAKEQRKRGHLSKDGLTYDDGTIRRVFELVETLENRHDEPPDGPGGVEVVERLRVVEEVYL